VLFLDEFILVAHQYSAKDKKSPTRKQRHEQFTATRNILTASAWTGCKPKTKSVINCAIKSLSSPPVNTKAADSVTNPVTIPAIQHSQRESRTYDRQSVLHFFRQHLIPTKGESCYGSKFCAILCSYYGRAPKSRVTFSERNLTVHNNVLLTLPASSDEFSSESFVITTGVIATMHAQREGRSSLSAAEDTCHGQGASGLKNMS
jgi:hypothetical protein